MTLLNSILIFFGAGLGGVFRYWISNGVYFLLGKEFPFGTLIVNISGCFCMGLLFALLMDRLGSISSLSRSFLLIGLLGGYTTFSSFTIETINLFENGSWFSALLNILLSVFLCLIGTWLGLIEGRRI